MFKKINKNKQFRRRKSSDNENASEDEEQNDQQETVEKTLSLQKLRQKPKGVSHVTLASGKVLSKVEEMTAKDADDPFKLKTGGLLDLAGAKKAKMIMDGDEEKGDNLGANKVGPEENDLGTQFSKETRIRDEDEEMRKFIELEMEKRKKGEENSDFYSSDKFKYLSPEDRALATLPEHLKKSHIQEKRGNVEQSNVIWNPRS